MVVVFFVQAEKEDAAGFEITGDVVDDVADVDVAVGLDGAVDDVFLEWVWWHWVGSWSDVSVFGSNHTFCKDLAVSGIVNWCVFSYLFPCHQ